MEFDMLTSSREDILRLKRKHFHRCFNSSSCMLREKGQAHDLHGLKHVLEGGMQEAF